MAAQMIPPAQTRPFLEAAGWGTAEVTPLAGDASFRRYFRVRDGDRRAVLMDAPPPEEDPRPFLKVAAYLAGHGFAAPAVYAQDLEHGLVLLEDFGDARVRDHLDAHPADEEAIYRRCVALLADLHRCPPAEVPPYDRAVYDREVDLFVDWYCPAKGLTVDKAAWRAAWDAVLPLAEGDAAPAVTVLRDYHAENIMLIEGRPQSRDLGLLDFQDALIGHPAYDLVSLLQDARRDVSPGLESAMLAHYRALAGCGEGFGAAYAVLGAQRNTKIIGIFTRLWQRDGKPRYLSFLPRMWGLLERDLAHPALAPVADWFDRFVPASARHLTLEGHIPA